MHYIKKPYYCARIQDPRKKKRREKGQYNIKMKQTRLQQYIKVDTSGLQEQNAMVYSWKMRMQY